ncbi:hypothetical protein IWQ56_001791 [Coemansia nantahalensis]|nr:hypothetical protein IWQ56_001791 [Coemansia nantahalensis]
MTEIGCNPEKIGSYTKVENGDAVEYTFVYSVLTPFLDPYQQQQYQQQQQEHQQYREKQQEEHYQYQEKQEEQYQYPEKQKEQQSCNVM